MTVMFGYIPALFCLRIPGIVSAACLSRQFILNMAVLFINCIKIGLTVSCGQKKTCIMQISVGYYSSTRRAAP